MTCVSLLDACGVVSACDEGVCDIVQIQLVNAVV
jgi:hypothetical protein